MSLKLIYKAPTLNNLVSNDGYDYATYTIDYGASIGATSTFNNYTSSNQKDSGTETTSKGEIL